VANFLTTVTFERTTGLAKDRVENTFAWVASDLATLRAMTDPAIVAFYNTVMGAHTLAEFISPTISRTAMISKINYYDVTTHLNGSPHGSPVATVPFTLGATDGSGALPSEVAVVMSFHGDFGVLPEVGAVDAAIPTEEEAIDAGAPAVHTGRDKPRARKRGRVYVGPLTLNATNLANDPIPSNNLIARLQAGGASFLALATAPWQVWSRRDAQMVTVTGGFIDNALDTQRRRGNSPTNRFAF